MPGRLSLVATPIGCLDDITLRALRVLGEADLILAEDTRRTRTLCAKHAIKTPLRSFHAYSEEDEVRAIIDDLLGGAHYALVSDAGTPVVSDPGAYLVARAAAVDIEVRAVPGPSAVLAALCVAGLPVRRFTFEGFLPRGGSARKRALERVGSSEHTVVLFESPHRIHATLRDLERHIGNDRGVALCRELTKIYEETLRGSLHEVRARLADPTKGEITLVIDGKPAEQPVEDIDLDALVSEWHREGLTTKEMARRLQNDFGWKRKIAYRAVLESRQRDADH